MAKTKRGAKPRTPRKTRTPRVPKSTDPLITNRSDEELRLALFYNMFDKSRSVEDVCKEVTKAFDYIKGVQTPSQAASPAPEVIPGDVLKEFESTGVELGPMSPKKSHFDEERILM